MNFFKKAFILSLICFLLLSLTIPHGVVAEPDNQELEAGEEVEENGLEELPFDVEASSALLIEVQTKEVFYAKDIDRPYPPASITKIMTLLLALEAIEEGKMDWDEIVTVSERAWEMQGSQMFLEIGQEVSVENLLKGISIVSANDACVAIAEHLYGSEEIFVQKMNEKASEIGLTNTRFQNTHGWPDPDHYMSARDIALLSAYTINTQPKILELESQREFTFNIDEPQYNRNPLLGRYPGADGLKTGWTNEAGYCLAGTAQQNNFRLISVVLNSPSNRARLSDTEALLDYGFKNYTFETVAEKNEIVGQADVPDGKNREVDLIAAEDMGVVVKNEGEENLEMEIVVNNLSAPLRQGDEAGEILALRDDEVLNRVPLLIKEDVERANIFVVTLRRVGDFFSGLAAGALNLFRDLLEE
ncbi:MAG: D-alanyl-D-alanine carboxypeptidase [Candidatus Syntrophonatronum acetioxidans]|uniref:serine-type D-Ala-D-Ala carboxypeptidase n=1 Tax=Candidatus Syntrophonatronum acetioxidans TaxID=1795816 RepID=A0A424YE06_9FIRM|nr:MAG: D-alanyl-D-alanine carboxypeptidase [Candidatus Syntrophonatronum acetioxidans]